MGELCLTVNLSMATFRRSYLKMRKIYPIALPGLFLLWSSFVVFADPTSTPKPASESGIEGTISVSPAHGGPTRQGVPDSKPLADTEFHVKVQSGVVATFKTDHEGRFRITLPAGHYTVSKKDSVAAMGNYSFDVEVLAGQVKRVHWECDIGIR